MSEVVEVALVLVGICVALPVLALLMVAVEAITKTGPHHFYERERAAREKQRRDITKADPSKPGKPPVAIRRVEI